MNGIGATVQAAGGGLVSLVARGGNTGAGQFGVRVADGGKVKGGTTGTLIVLGTGGTGGGPNNDGVRLQGDTTTAGVITSAGASAQITGVAGFGTTPVGIRVGFATSVNSYATITTAANGGGVTLIGDTISVSPNAALSTTSPGSVLLRPLSVSRLINLGSVVKTTANTLELSDAELGRITTGTLIIGDATSGAITVSAVLSPTNYKTLALGRNTTFTAASGFTADIGPTAADYEKITVSGTVTLDNGAALTLNPTGGFAPVIGQTFTLLANDAADAISGVFTGPTLNPFLGSSLAAAISYVGGSGNDVVLTTVDPASQVTSNGVVSALPAWVAPGGTFTLSQVVRLLPNVATHTVARSIPEGWAVTQVSHLGTFDSGTRTITWGPFADNFSRALSAQVSAPAAANQIGFFPGTGRFDGVPTPMTGPRTTAVLPHAAGAASVGGELLVFGSNTNDVIAVNAGIYVTINGTDTGTLANPGRIVVFGQGGDDNLSAANAVLSPVELYGGPGHDTLKGGGGNDFLYGEEGNDFVVSSPGFDTFSGGSGQDGVVFYGTSEEDTIEVSWHLIKDGQNPAVVTHPPFPIHRDGLRVFVNGVAHEMEYTPEDDFETIVVHAGAGNDHVEMLDDAAAQHWNAEFHGEEGDDTLIGSRNLSDKRRGNDRLFGGPGNDTLIGHSGNDWLEGGPGQDQLDGGIGINHLMTDGLDRLLLNIHDAVELAAVYPDVQSATVNWGDGAVGAGTVDSVKGLVTGIHAYQLRNAGPITITVTTVGAGGGTTVHTIPATVIPGPLAAAPGALVLERASPARWRVVFPAVPGSTYVLQGTTELGAAQWSTIGQQLAELDGFVRFELENQAQRPAQFFRALALIDMISAPLTAAPGALVLERVSPARLRVVFPAVPGGTYVLQATSDLGTAQWSTIGQKLGEPDGFARFELENWDQKPAQFFRALSD